MLKAISFLGLGKYVPVTYVWTEREGPPLEYRTHLFPEAVANIFRPDKILLLVTRSALADAEFGDKLTALSGKLGDLLEIVEIPDGKAASELWEIFDICTERVAEGEKVILDVTHAFRSLPLIVFTVGAFLRRTKGVTVERVVYGAYEARDPLTQRAPIFDLNPLHDLLDWSSGAEAFLRGGDGTLLAERLAETRRILARSHEEEDLPTRLKSVADGLRRLSDALRLSRPRDAMRLAEALLNKLDGARDEIVRWAKPFAAILETTKKEIEPLAYSCPDVLDSENLRKQLALMHYYLQKGLTVQAVTLCREWLVSWLCLKAGKASDWLKASYREELEASLSRAAKSLRGPSYESANPCITREVASIWNEVIVYRNAIAHCGMREDEPSADKVRNAAWDLVQRLNRLLEEQ